MEEGSQLKTILCDFICLKCQKDKSIKLKSGLAVARGWREEEGMERNGEGLLMDTGFLFWTDENVLKLDSSDGCTIL